MRIWSQLAGKLRSRNTLLVVYLAAGLLSAASKLRLHPAAENGHYYPPLQNFAIFRDSFFHLIHHQDLYTRFPAEYGDYYKYSPSFALLMAPWAALPYALGAILWNVLNALALFYALWTTPLPNNGRKALALWFVLLPLTVSLQNAQSNALVAALMLGAWLAQERGQLCAASFSVALSAFIKLFGILAAVPCWLVGARRKFVASVALWTALLATAPLLVVSPAQLLGLYQSWRARLQADQASWKAGLDLAGVARAWFHLELPERYVLPVALAILLGVLAMRREAWSDRAFRLLAVASVLVWVVIFNFRAESPAMIIAVTGVALWYFCEPGQQWRSRGWSARINLILLISTFLLTCVSPTEGMPRALRRQLPIGYMESAPCILVWLKMQYDLLRFPVRAPAPPGNQLS
jgi:Glycosyltransferase family 87